MLLALNQLGTLSETTCPTECDYHQLVMAPNKVHQNALANYTLFLSRGQGSGEDNPFE